MSRYLKALLCHLMFFALASGAMSSADAFAATDIGVAAIVNNELITSSDVSGRYHMAVKGANLNPNAAEAKEIRKQALEALIDEQIRLQAAKRENVLPEEKEVDEAFARLASQNNLPPEQFKKVLNQTTGVYESLRRQLKTQLAWNNVILKRIRPQVSISENDVDAYLQQRAKNTAKVEYQIAEIFMRNNDSNKQLAQKLLQDLRSGKQRFSVIARQFSQGLEASKGGLLGWIEEKRLEPVLDQAIAKTPVGSLTDVITSQRGLHIVLVLDKRDILSSDQASKRLHLKQILLKLPPNIPADVHKQAREHMAFLRSEAKDCKTMDDVIAKVDSPLARDLGQVRLADIPSAVRPLVQDLPLDTISETQKMAEGYAIYMVCGRSENSEEDMRSDITEMLGMERMNRLQNRYYRDLRASSFVDIKEN